MPDGVYVEAGNFVRCRRTARGRDAARGDLLFSGVGDASPRPKVSTFASGLDEVLGLAWRDGAFYATHATEVTRIADTNGDGRADRFDTVSDAWGFGHYHEYACGSKFDAAGNLYVALGLSESYNSKALFRGWALKISPDGKAVPLCSGLRSPLGVGANESGEMFYVESQGPWNGSCSLKHLKPGGFMGHPISFNCTLRAAMGAAPLMPSRHRA